MASKTASAGAHVMEFVEPDIVVYRLCGRVEAPEVCAMGQQHVAWCGPEDPYVLALLDVRQFKDLSTAALRAARNLRAKGTPRAFAMLGTSFTARVALGMLTHALRLVSGALVLVEYFPDEPQALAWLAERRPELKAVADRKR